METEGAYTCPPVDDELEVLEPRLAKSEALPLIRSAQRHWRTARRATLLLCAELRKLQDGEAHRLYGYANFGQFCVEKIAPELTEGQATKFSWQGAPLLVLERHERLSLNDRAELPVGTTGAQALSTILRKQGEEAMLEAFDVARSLKPGRPLSDVTVARARRELSPPKPRQEPVEPQEPREPYTSDEDEAYNFADLPDELRQTRLALDDLIDGIVQAEPSEQDRVAALREITVIRARLDKIAASLGKTR